MTNNTTYTLLTILIIFFVIFYGSFYIKKIRRFTARKKYFQMELGRSHPDDIKFWKRKLLKEYLSMIPFFGIFFEKLMK